MLIAAARQEGNLTLNTMAGAVNRKAVDAFEEAYPGIRVEHTTYTTGSIWAPKVIQERDAGIHTWDVSQIPPNTALTTLKPAGIWESIRPAIVHPEVTADKSWRGGFEFGFIDTDRTLTYAFGITKNSGVWINSDMVKEGEIKSITDLLNPKWKGKMTFTDVRTGFTFLPATAIRKRLGDDVMKRLFVDQQPVYNRDRRLVNEQMIRGSYAISIGISRVWLRDEYLPQGLGKNLVQLRTLEDTYLSEASVFLHKGAPHPNEAKLFINWILSKDGQAKWTEQQDVNSRRTDVAPVDPETAVEDGEEKKFPRLQTEEAQDYVEETRIMLEKLTGA